MAPLMAEEDPVGYTVESEWWEHCPTNGVTRVDFWNWNRVEDMVDSRGCIPLHMVHLEVTTSRDDQDPNGPNCAWPWALDAFAASERFPSGRSLWARYQSCLREWGYVMWDKAKLERSGIFNSSLQSLADGYTVRDSLRRGKREETRRFEFEAIRLNIEDE